jgi:CBS domain-containing protein
VTESDIVRKVIGEDRGHYHVPVETIMSSPVVGIEERRPLTEAADMMDKYRTRHLAVTRGGRFVGILSVRDLLRPVSVDDF